MQTRTILAFSALLLSILQLAGTGAAHHADFLPRADSCLSPALSINTQLLSQSLRRRYAREQSERALSDTIGNRKNFGKGKFILEHAELIPLSIQKMLWEFLQGHDLVPEGNSRRKIYISFIRSNERVHNPSYKLYRDMMQFDEALRILAGRLANQGQDPKQHANYQQMRKKRNLLQKELENILIAHEDPFPRNWIESVLSAYPEKIRLLTGKRPVISAAGQRAKAQQILAQYYLARVQYEFGRQLEWAVEARKVWPAFFSVRCRKGKKLEADFEVRIERRENILQASGVNKLPERPQQLSLFGPDLRPNVLLAKKNVYRENGTVAESI